MIIFVYILVALLFATAGAAIVEFIGEGRIARALGLDDSGFDR